MTRAHTVAGSGKRIRLIGVRLLVTVVPRAAEPIENIGMAWTRVLIALTAHG